MKAPDKIYIPPRVDDGSTLSSFWFKEKHTVNDDIEYIRKEALLDILNDAIKYLSDGSLAGYYESMAYQDIIDKLNSM